MCLRLPALSSGTTSLAVEQSLRLVPALAPSARANKLCGAGLLLRRSLPTMVRPARGTEASVRPVVVVMQGLLACTQRV